MTYSVANLEKLSRLLCNLIVAGSHLHLPFTTMTNPCLTTLPPAPALPSSLLAGCLADVLTEIHAINYELCIPSRLQTYLYVGVSKPTLSSFPPSVSKGCPSLSPVSRCQSLPTSASLLPGSTWLLPTSSAFPSLLASCP